MKSSPFGLCCLMLHFGAYFNINFGPMTRLTPMMKLLRKNSDITLSVCGILQSA